MPTVLSSRDYGIVFQRVDDGVRLDHVPPHVYTLTLIGNPMDGLELMLQKDRKVFNVPAKLYGDNNDYLSMIYDDWRDTEGAIGAMLYGKKGCGKTVLAEMIANKILQNDVPVFLIDSKIPTGMIKSALAACPNGAMVLFDEFEKIYDEDAQKELLILFSDSDLKKVLFIMTVNDSDEINDFLINRPGRVKFWIHYEGIDDRVVVELMDEMKVPKVLRSGIREWARDLGDDVSFDIMKFVCKEATKCTSYAQLVKRIKVLNVPAMRHHDYELSSVHVNNREYWAENVKFEMLGERSFSIGIKCQETGIDLYEEFDMQCGGDGRFDRTVHLPGDIILDIYRSTKPYWATEDAANKRVSVKPVPKEVAQEPLGKNQLMYRPLNLKESSAESSMSLKGIERWLVPNPSTSNQSAERIAQASQTFISETLDQRRSSKAEILANNGSFGKLSESSIDSGDVGRGRDFDGDSFAIDTLSKFYVPIASRGFSSISMLSSKHTSAGNKKDPKGDARNEGKPRKGF